MNEFDDLNGFLVEKGEKIFDTSLRLMKYGDGVFETMKVVDGEIRFWDDHYARLKKGIEKLKFDDSNKPKEFWEEELKKVIIKNYYKYARIRLIVFRDSPGVYTPMTNRIGFLIEGMRYDKAGYNFSSKDFKLGVYEEEKKALNGFSNLKTCNSLLFVLASLYKKENELDEVLILNDKGSVAETSTSNVFGVLNNVVITPKLDEGGLDGVMRKQVINYLKENNIKIEEKKVTEEMLNDCQEIFLTNTISGVQSVTHFKGKVKSSELTQSIQQFFENI